MKQRLISSAVLVAILVAVLYIGSKALLCVAFIINAMALYEFINVVDNDSNKLAIRKILYIAVGTIPLAIGFYNVKMLIPTLPLVVVAITIINILSGKYNSDYTVYNIFGVMYVSLILALMVTVLRQLPNAQALAVIMFGLFVSVATDSFAYLGGMNFGKKKLCPEISPKKSVEGAISGFIFGIIAGIILYLVYSHFNIISLSLIDCIIMGAICSILDQFGDLAASMIKRNFGVKDYSNLIPGHGGILDRIDGILFSLAGTFFYISVILNLVKF